MKRRWRLLHRLAADAADLAAVPWAVAAGRVICRMACLPRSTETVIVQRVRGKGIVAGAEVAVDREEAARSGIQVACLPAGSAAPAGTIPLQLLMARCAPRFRSVERSDSDLAALIYTSGTTGRPKGVMLSHGNFAAECAATRTVITTTLEDRFCSLVPFFHVFGLAEGCVTPLERGCATVLVPQYTPRVFLQALRRDHPTVILAIPTQYSHLVQATRRHSPRVRRPLKYCISGAAPLPVPVIEEFRAKFGLGVTEGFGMTETTAAVTLNPVERVRPGSIGVPIAGAQMRVVDEQGRELPDGQSGEILVRGGMVCSGYYNMPAETAAAFDPQGFLRTGDIGYRDADGYYYITDRKKDIIIKGGYNISPREVEEVLLQHHGVKEAAVVGIVEEDRRETITAFCIPAEGEHVDGPEVLDFCRKSLATYKTPDEIVFVEVLPRSATGKLLRQELREQAAARRRGRGGA